MKSQKRLFSLLAGLSLCSFTMLRLAEAQVLFKEGFNSAPTANVLQNSETDTIVQFVDYSSFVVGAENFSIPEAPNMVTGSAATSGVLMRANLVNGAPAIINFIAADAPGGTPISFSGNYRLTFDMWLSVRVPVGLGGTEQLVYGIGHDGGVPLGRSNRLQNTVGTWGWVATELGYSTEDAVIYENTTELERLGNTQVGQEQPFVDAFGGNPDQAPANAWTEVDVLSMDGNVQVRYNGVLFHDVASSATSGFAVAGYEDAFDSLAEFPDFQWGILDNMVVEAILACDFSGDGECDITDLDMMQALGPIINGIPAAGNEPFDLNGDDVIDLDDRDQWLGDAASVNGLASPYKIGDANLDGFVDGQDFIVWNGNKFTSTLLWSKGDFTADGFADGQDFIEWNMNKFTSSDVVTVPEPSSWISLLTLLLAFGVRRLNADA